MSLPKLNKDQVQKIGLSIVGFIFLLYVYFSFFLGPLNRSRDSMLATMKDKKIKLDRSTSDLSKAATLEQQAKSATNRFAALKALNPEGAPIAWFPPRIKLFFANQQIDKAGARLESTSGFKQPELANWMKYTWLIDFPQADYATVGKAIAAIENAEPLLAITRISIRATSEQPQFQTVALTATNYIQKK
jgi:hypothetical protein